jgi:hypothetical protein
MQVVNATTAPGVTAALLAWLEAALQQADWLIHALKGCQGAGEAEVAEPAVPGALLLQVPMRMPLSYFFSFLLFF